MKKIPLTRGKFALVDDEDFEFLNQWTWFAHKAIRSNTFYALRNSRRSEGLPRKTVRMHVVLVGQRSGEIIDHKNRNGLDNRRNNLRHTSPAESARNREHPKSIKAIQGVAAHKDGGFTARGPTMNGVRPYLGYFKTIQMAENAVRKHLREV